MFLRPFNPSYGSNQVVTPAAASAAATINKNDDQIRVVNSGLAKGYFRTYSSQTVPAPAATVADCVVLPNGTVTVTKGQEHDRIAYISATGTTFEVMTGDGF